MRPSGDILTKCVDDLTPHLLRPCPLTANLADQWPTPDAPFTDFARVTADILAPLRPHVSEIRAMDLHHTRLDAPAYQGIFHQIGRAWHGNRDNDALFDAQFIGSLAGSLLYSVPRAVFADPHFLSRLWDPGVLNNPRTVFPNIHRTCAALPDTSETVAFVPCVHTLKMPCLYLYTARPHMPVLFRAMLDHAQMTEFKISNLNGYYGREN